MTRFFMGIRNWYLVYMCMLFNEEEEEEERQT